MSTSLFERLHHLWLGATAPGDGAASDPHTTADQQGHGWATSEDSREQPLGSVVASQHPDTTGSHEPQQQCMFEAGSAKQALKSQKSAEGEPSGENQQPPPSGPVSTPDQFGASPQPFTTTTEADTRLCFSELTQKAYDRTLTGVQSPRSCQPVFTPRGEGKLILYPETVLQVFKEPKKGKPSSISLDAGLPHLADREVSEKNFSREVAVPPEGFPLPPSNPSTPGGIATTNCRVGLSPQHFNEVGENSKTVDNVLRHNDHTDHTQHSTQHMHSINSQGSADSWCNTTNQTDPTSLDVDMVASNSMAEVLRMAGRRNGNAEG